MEKKKHRYDERIPYPSFINFAGIKKAAILVVYILCSVASAHATFTIHYGGTTNNSCEYSIIQGTNTFDIKTDSFSGSETISATPSSGTALTAQVITSGSSKIIRITGTSGYSTNNGSSRTITLKQTSGSTVSFRLYVVTSSSTDASRIQLSRNVLTIPQGTARFIIPYQNINRGMANADVAVSGATGISAHFERDSLSLSFSITTSSSIYTTTGTYNLTLGGGIGSLTLNVIAAPTVGTLKFAETFGTAPTTWTDSRYGNSSCALPARYNYYRGELQSTRGSIGSAYTFRGFASSPSCGTSGPSLADGEYALSVKAGTGRTDDAWYGQSTDTQNPYDHTGDTDGTYHNGLMLVVNAAFTPGVFYKRQVNGLCNGSDFIFSFWLANILSPLGAANNVPINVQYEIWESDPGESFTASQANAFTAGSTYNGVKLLYMGYTGDIPGFYSDYMVWRNYKLYCTMPETRDNVFVVLRNRGEGGAGNDLAIDDIQFYVYTPLKGISSSVQYGNDVPSGKIRLKAKVEGNLTVPYYYRWQRAEKGTDAWVNMDEKPALLSTVINSSGELYSDYNFSYEYANSDFRLVVAKEMSAFDNASCFLVLTTCSSSIPYVRITSPLSVCSEATYADFLLKVSFYGTMVNNEWKFEYRREDGELTSVTVKDSTHYYLPQRINKTTNYTLVSSETGSNKITMNQPFQVEFNPEAILAGNVRIEGASEVCIYENYYTYSVLSDIPLPASTIYAWNVGSGNQIVGDTASSSVKIKFNGQSPVSVAVTAYSPCRNENVTVNRTIVTSVNGPQPTATTQFPDICVCSSCGDYTKQLLTITPSPGAVGYYWYWDNSYSSYFEYNDADQILGKTGKYLDKIILRVKNNITADGSFVIHVTSNNECGASTRDVGLRIKKANNTSFTLSYSSANVCPSDTYNLTTVPKSLSTLTYTYYSDSLGLSPVTSPDKVTAGTYYIRGTESGGCFSIRPFVVKMQNLTVNVPVTYDASCSKCPVTVQITSPSTDVYKYYLFESKDETDRSKGYLFTQLNSTTKQVSFSGKTGDNEYFIKKDSVCLSSAAQSQLLHIYVAPSFAQWNGSNSFGDHTTWQSTFNWNATGYPLWCTDVEIPENAANYPTLIDGDACRDITFKNGASVGQIQKLLYRKAFVEFRPDRNRWYMASAPLRYMYSADYHGDMSWSNAISPKTYIMYFNMQNNRNPDGRTGYVIGNFSTPFAKLEESLPMGSGFALWLNGVGNGLTYDDTNFPTGTPYKFPRRLANGNDVSYSYHDKNTGQWLNASEPLNRGNVAAIPDSIGWINSHANLSASQKDNRFRFIFEESYSGGIDTRTVVSGSTNIVGNPFMSHINFAKFAEDNATNIYSYYRIWDGSKFYAYITGSDNELWTGLNGISTTTDNTLTQYIAPMQSFFVETKPGRNSLTFNPQNISVAQGSVNSRMKSNAAQPDDLLRLNLAMNKVTSQSIIVVRKNASLSYLEGEDIKKLFSPDASVPEIYTIANDSDAIEINLIGDDTDNVTIPVGIRTSQKGTATLSVDGVDAFTAYSEIKLMDKLLNKEYDLRQDKSFTFSKDTDQAIEDRFYIRFNAKRSSIDSNSDEYNEINVYSRNGILIRSTNKLLKHITLYDATGHVVFDKDNVNNLEYTINNYYTVSQGVYLVKIETLGETKIFKVII
ncbi:MAG: T9SS type A sorting domain-containing protein [Dysgonomonas sp.]